MHQITNFSELTPAQYIILGVALVLAIIAHWRIFTKAGKPGWATLIPIYNVYVLLKIVGRPGWWLLFAVMPIANVIIYIVVIYDLAQSFGKGVGYTLLMLIFPTLGQLILGFGSAKYVGPRIVTRTLG